MKSLPAVLRSNRDSAELNQAATIAAWKYVTGEGLRNHARAQALEGKTLVVAVRDEVWQKQLSTMTNQLLFKINSLLGQSLVSNIELRINPNALHSIPSKGTTRKELTDSEIPVELWSAANAIKDKELRQKFLRAATGLLRRKEQQHCPSTNQK